MNRAACNGHTDCVRLLVEAKSDKEIKNWVRANGVDFHQIVSVGLIDVFFVVMISDVDINIYMMRPF